MPFLGAVVSRVLGHGFHPPLNPAIENTICVLRTDTDSNESSDLTHKTRAVISGINLIYTLTDGDSIKEAWLN